MKVIRIISTYWQVGATGAAEPLVTAGQELPADDPVGLRQLALRNAEEVDVPEPAAANPDPAPTEPAAETAPARGRRTKTAD